MVSIIMDADSAQRKCGYELQYITLNNLSEYFVPILIYIYARVLYDGPASYLFDKVN